MNKVVQSYLDLIEYYKQQVEEYWEANSGYTTLNNGVELRVGDLVYETYNKKYGTILEIRGSGSSQCFPITVEYEDGTLSCHPHFIDIYHDLPPIKDFRYGYI